MSHSTRGFTLFEMMIVVALIGLAFVAMNFTGFDSRIQQTSVERLANSIRDQIHTARTNMIIGRGIYTGSVLLPISGRTISITPMSIITSYLDQAGGSGTEVSFVSPYFDNDPRYQISDIAVSSVLLPGDSSAWDFTGVTSADIILNKDGELSISANKGSTVIPASSIITLRIAATYGNFTRYITVNRINSIAEISLTGSVYTPVVTQPPLIINGACNNTTLYACTAGTSSNNTPGSCGGSATWGCDGSNGGTSTTSCSQSNPACGAIAGVGGTASGVATSTTPTTALCSVGTASSVTTNTSTYNWTCTGPINGSTPGTSISVSAPRLPVCTQAGSLYPSCTAVGQIYTASSTYPGCDTPDKAICTCVGYAMMVPMCNVGSTIAGTSTASYGSMFQWGRNHPFPSSGTVPTLAGPIPLSGLAAADNMNQFIVQSLDWLSSNDDNRWGGLASPTYLSATPADQILMQGPCSVSYHVPTTKEWCDVIDSINGTSNCASSPTITAHTTLKIPLSGYLFFTNSSLHDLGSSGFFWSSTPIVTGARDTYFSPLAVRTDDAAMRAFGFSLRCMKN